MSDTDPGRSLTVADLAGVVYSSGKVFDGLSTGRLDTESFLRSGSTEGITTRADLALLEDLRDVAQFIIDHRDRSIDADYARSVNTLIARSGALEPGRYHTDEDRIGVTTRHGRHEPPAPGAAGLDRIIQRATELRDPREQALELFIEIARAQPFMDPGAALHGREQAHRDLRRQQRADPPAEHDAARGTRRRGGPHHQPGVQRPARSRLRLRRVRRGEGPPTPTRFQPPSRRPRAVSPGAWRRDTSHRDRARPDPRPGRWARLGTDHLTWPAGPGIGRLLPEHPAAPTLPSCTRPHW